jgi:hypothetical protein
VENMLFNGCIRVGSFEINDIEFRRVLPSTTIDEFIETP